MEKPYKIPPKIAYGLFGGQLKEREVEIIQKDKLIIQDNYYPQGNECKGFADPENLDIYVHSELSTEEKIITVFHELTHINFPGMTEDQIEEFAMTLFKNLNTRQQNFFELFIESTPISSTSE